MKKVEVRSKLKDIVHSKRMSMRGFARSIGHSHEQVRLMCHDRVERFPREMLEKIIEVHNVGIEDILEVVWIEEEK